MPLRAAVPDAVLDPGPADEAGVTAALPGVRVLEGVTVAEPDGLDGVLPPTGVTEPDWMPLPAPSSLMTF